MRAGVGAGTGAGAHDSDCDGNGDDGNAEGVCGRERGASSQKCGRIPHSLGRLHRAVRAECGSPRGDGAHLYRCYSRLPQQRRRRWQKAAAVKAAAAPEAAAKSPRKT